MVASHQEIDTIWEDTIDHAVLTGDASRPQIRAKMFQWFWFPDSCKGITEYGLHEFKQAQRNFSINLGPVNKVLTELLAARRAALAPLAALLSSLERDNRLYHPRAQLWRSHVHLHANRLLGTDPRREQRTLQLLRRTRAGLSRAPMTSK